MVDALLAFIIGSIALGAIVGMVLKVSRMTDSRPDDWDVDQDELHPQTSRDAKRFGYTGDRCPSCHSYRMVSLDPDGGLPKLECLECRDTWPIRI